jgi:hypothetical protein
MRAFSLIFSLIGPLAKQSRANRTLVPWSGSVGGEDGNILAYPASAGADAA